MSIFEREKTFEGWMEAVTQLIRGFFAQPDFNPQTSEAAWRSYFDAGYKPLAAILHASFRNKLKEGLTK